MSSTIPPSFDTDPARAWAVLYDHPALTWIPPLWRLPDGPDRQGRRHVQERHAVRAIERNLVVQVQPAPDGGFTVKLATGPLRDRPMGDGVDPIAPTAAHDSRLDVTASTFESALCALAARVTAVYGASAADTVDSTLNFRAGGPITG